MATILYDNGTSEVRMPSGEHWGVEELQGIVGGYFEIISTIDGRFMVIDDEGKLKGKHVNREATKLYIHGRKDLICGTAIVVDTRLELDGPEDDDDDEDIEAL